jgi:hypothetical protein
MVLFPPLTQLESGEVERKLIGARKITIQRPNLRIKKDDYQGFPSSWARGPICYPSNDGFNKTLKTCKIQHRFNVEDLHRLI